MCTLSGQQTTSLWALGIDGGRKKVSPLQNFGYFFSSTLQRVQKAQHITVLVVHAVLSSRGCETPLLLSSGPFLRLCGVTTSNYQYVFLNQRVLSGCQFYSIELCFPHKIWTSNLEWCLKILTILQVFKHNMWNMLRLPTITYLTSAWHHPIDEYNIYRLGFKI